ncbi:1-deoxy-D-xylulose 5-phosphate reductoisomerase 2 [Jeotgalicoccus coquinae]|uniref:1-deoxy-D-xylulose 5-phosphate reductoisomerase n=1 Tax=Jeotgalicoccus coquinae TaxID=709509 RepID=A0A6V7RJD9_9STAP|nr:1-deoxy-D-xylulose-5-phosphate reductoisomerase [Jeotgalicoccus coquinae]MBB6422611.1 1-deoxy-D-xylulose-5-phosphate reductoisomerase [Jeotgalicoccus coquinae]GGE14496.1 1-deoxy-D-xylulose 5-phosphate reductoisomerase 2 [Jeotgalicoccus coquinae]CAD2077826.1 1-deoxy-D-xylulose 5-phosphate reductoisomerase [Jeotgalicoccus coquinae]
MIKTISVLGVTGSIGTQALDVIKNNPEHFKLGAISAGRNLIKLEEILADFNPPLVSVQDDSAVKELKSRFPHIEFMSGDEGLISVATYDSNLLLTAILGSVGLKPTLAAIDAGIDIALANKETLVAAGEIVMNRAREKNVQIIPVDSEHSALFQCLKGENEKEISNIIITASGGSFRDLSREELGSVTLEDALNHPNWSMGQKITIDSATMMNKGFEVIEAKHLFDVEISQIKTLLHKESIIHSMVEFIDNSIMAQLGNSDMRTAIQYAFTHPERLHKNNPLSVSELSQLNFKPMDFDRFKMLKFAYDALEAGGTLPTVMNAANEYAVGEFLGGRIKFLEIEEIVESRMMQHENIQNPDLETILSLDARYKSNMR